MKAKYFRSVLPALLFVFLASVAFARVTIFFDDGRVIQGDIEKLKKKDSKLTVKTEGKKKDFKLFEMQSIHFMDDRDLYREDYKKISEDEDTFFLNNGDIVYGFIEKLDKKSLSFSTSGPEKSVLTYAIADVNRMYFGSTLSDFSRKEVGGGLNFFSKDQEIKMGMGYAAEVEKQVPILRDQYVENYINDLGTRIARASRRPGIEYHFNVVNTADVNAFAVPGGFVYVNRGLLEKADNESEVAGVLAHEIGHVVGRHSTRQLSKQLLTVGILTAASVAAGVKSDTAAQLIQQGGGAFAFFTFMKYSRNMEREADLLGAHALYEAGYDPNSMLTFFEKLRQISGHDPGKFETFLSTHPSPAERIENIGGEIQTMKDTGRRQTDSPDFADLKHYLTELPPPPKQPPKQGTSQIR
jgi:Zn-dependent protease with chaperone function